MALRFIRTPQVVSKQKQILAMNATYNNNDDFEPEDGKEFQVIKEVTCFFSYFFQVLGLAPNKALQQLTNTPQSNDLHEET